MEKKSTAQTIIPEADQKTDIAHLETQSPTSESIPETNEKLLLRKLDRRLVPWVSLLYLLSFLDSKFPTFLLRCSLLLMFFIIKEAALEMPK